MKTQQTALGKYLSNYCSHSIGRMVVKQHTTKNTDIMTKMGQSNGKKVDKNHPSYELSLIVSDFKNGENTSIMDLTVTDYKKYFTERGPHYTAGYLSRFGKVVTGLDGLVSNPANRLIEKPAYRAAKKVWKEYQNSRK